MMRWQKVQTTATRPRREQGSVATSAEQVFSFPILRSPNIFIGLLGVWLLLDRVRCDVVRMRWWWWWMLGAPRDTR